jgi:hypothetical protein
MQLEQKGKEIKQAASYHSLATGNWTLATGF